MYLILKADEITTHELFQAAIDLDNKGRYKEALELYNDIIKINPNHVNALNNRAIINSKNINNVNNVKDAIADLKNIISIDPKYTKAYGNLAFIYNDMRMYDEAIENLNIAINTDPNESWNYDLRSSCYLNIKQYALAEEDSLKAVNIVYPEYYPQDLVTLVGKDQYEKGSQAVISLLQGGFYVKIKWECDLKGNPHIILPYTKRNRLAIQLNKDEIHIGKTIRKHIQKYESRYEFRFDDDFTVIFDALEKYYREEIHGFAQFAHYYFSSMNHNVNSPRAAAAALYKDGKLVAGEIGFIIGKVYSSYTGYHDSGAPSSGTVQCIYLAQYLKKEGFVLIDYGPTIYRWDNYKLNLGAKMIKWRKYQSLLYKANPRRKKIFKLNPDINLKQVNLLS